MSYRDALRVKAEKKSAGRQRTTELSLPTVERVWVLQSSPNFTAQCPNDLAESQQKAWLNSISEARIYVYT